MSSRSKHSTSIVFDDIILGSTVRATVIDGGVYLAVRDLIMVVNEQSLCQAGNTWRSLVDFFKEEILLKWTDGSFKGRDGGKTAEPVISLRGAMKLLVLLPQPKHMSTEACRSNRAKAAKILGMYSDDGGRTAKSEPDLGWDEHEELSEARVFNVNLREQLEIRRQLLEVELDGERKRLALFVERNKEELEHRKAMLKLGESASARPAAGVVEAGSGVANPYLYPWVRDRDMRPQPFV